MPNRLRLSYPAVNNSPMRGPESTRCRRPDTLLDPTSPTEPRRVIGSVNG
jgi:hypothetical protein